jgi:hypothetical protein
MERAIQPPYAGKEEVETKTSRSDEARRVIEEYANDLKEIIKKQRGSNWRRCASHLARVAKKAPPEQLGRGLAAVESHSPFFRGRDQSRV